MSDYEQLAQEIRAKRNYREEPDGTIFCDIRGCPGSVGLRCRRTEVPICKHCAVQTPVGYVSREAARAQQDTFYNAETLDYIKAGVAAFLGNLVVGFIATRIATLLFFGFIGFFIIFFIATAAAGLISEIIWRALNKKRGRRTDDVITMGLVASSLLLLPITDIFVISLYGGIVVVSVRARFQMGIRL